MDKIEAEVPTDLLAGLLMASAPAPMPRQRNSLVAKVFAVMGLTSALTFGALVAGYQLFFSHQLFA